MAWRYTSALYGPPALTNISYKNMEIADGSAASSEYVRVTFGKALGTERKRVYDALLKYCELDTHIMIDIIKGLGKLVGFCHISNP